MSQPTTPSNFLCPICHRSDGLHPNSCLEATARTIAATYGKMIADIYLRLETTVNDKYINVGECREVLERTREQALMLKGCYFPDAKSDASNTREQTRTDTAPSPESRTCPGQQD